MANSSIKIRTLSSSADFQKLSRSRHRITKASWLMAKFIKTDEALRVGWTLPRQVGSAVTRNRLKRWAREFIRKNQDWLCKIHLDVNLVFRSTKAVDLKELGHEEFDQQLYTTFKALGRLRDPSRGA